MFFVSLQLKKYHVLDSLITSKTRIKMLLKFFTNSQATAYLRSLASEFGESTNAIRVELNNLSNAGYLVSSEAGRTILYRANTKHPLYADVRNLVHKHLGIDKIIENILLRLGNLDAAFIVGDYAKGKDSGTIELLLVGEVNEKYLKKLVEKVKKLIHREIKTRLVSKENFESGNAEQEERLLIWKKDDDKKFSGDSHGKIGNN